MLTQAERARTAEALGRAQAFAEADPAGEAAAMTAVPDREAGNSSMEEQIRERAAPQPALAMEMSTRENGMLAVTGDADAVLQRLMGVGMKSRAIRGSCRHAGRWR